VEPEPEAGAAQTTAAQLQMAAQKAALDAQLKAQQDAASVTLALQLQRQEAEAAQAEARHADAQGVCRLLAAPGVDAPLAMVCCQRARELGDSGVPGKASTEGTAFNAAGGCRALVRAMRSHAAVANLQAEACAALWVLARGAEGQAALRAAGGAEAVVRALRAHVSVAAVQEEGCGAAWCLASTSVGGRAALRRLGAVELAQAARRNHPTHGGVQKMSAGLLRNL
jgi:hypothetical protein